MAYPAGHRDEVKGKIVQSARRLFNRHGFDGVSVDERAEQRGASLAQHAADAVVGA